MDGGPGGGFGVMGVSLSWSSGAFVSRLASRRPAAGSARGSSVGEPRGNQAIGVGAGEGAGGVMTSGPASQVHAPTGRSAGSS